LFLDAAVKMKDVSDHKKGEKKSGPFRRGKELRKKKITILIPTTREEKKRKNVAGEGGE